MALLFSCGFDQFDDYAGLDDMWGNTPASAVTLEATGGAFGGKHVRVDTNSPSSANGLKTPTLAAAATQRGAAANPFHMAFWHRGQTTPDSLEDFLWISNSENPTEGVRFFSQSDGTWDIHEYDNTTGTLRGSTTTDMMDGAWHHVEMTIVISDTVGVYKVWIDGTLEVDFSGDTFGLGSTLGSLGLDLVYFGGHDPISVDIVYADYDDILIWDEEGSGLVTSGQLNQHRIDVIFPTADGNSEQWTPSAGTDSFALVDELSAADGDTTYIEDGTTTEQSIFTHGGMSYVPNTVHGVAIHAQVKIDSGTKGLFGRVRHSTSEANNDEGELTIANTGYAEKLFYFAQNPSAGPGAWTQTTVDANEFGLRVGT